MAVQITLTQGATTIATRSVSELTGSFVDYSFDLTSLELALITDSAALVLTFTSGATGEAVSYARVEVNASRVQAFPRITEDGLAYRITEDGTAYRITEGEGDPVIIENATLVQASFFAVF